MEFNNDVIQWLLQDDNPAVKYRTMTELLDMASSDFEVTQAKKDVLRWLPQAADASWMMDVKGLWLRYNLLALAECGLTSEDINISPALARCKNIQFDAACGDTLLLRALVALGSGDEPIVKQWLNSFAANALPDGGFLCLHRLNKMKYTPKSCIKDNMHVLLLLAECSRHGLHIEYSDRLVGYFLKRNVFYRSDDPSTLVLDCRKGGRMTDNFFPAEVMRVGLPQLMYAFAILGVGKAPELAEAWVFLENKKDRSGKYLLEGTLAKSYLPKEKVAKPGKWVTFYSLMALKHKNNG